MEDGLQGVQVAFCDSVVVGVSSALCRASSNAIVALAAQSVSRRSRLAAKATMRRRAQPFQQARTKVSLPESDAFELECLNGHSGDDDRQDEHDDRAPLQVGEQLGWPHQG